MSAPDRQTFTPIAFILAAIIGYGVYWNVSQPGDARSAAIEAARLAPHAETDLRATGPDGGPDRVFGGERAAHGQRFAQPDRRFGGVAPPPRSEILRRRLSDPDAVRIGL